MPDIADALHTLCRFMDATDSSELVIEMGIDGGQMDGSRYLIHVIRKEDDEDDIQEE